MAFAEVPVIDISLAKTGAEERVVLADQIGKICHEIGFFVVVNHGVSIDLTRSVFATMPELFGLDDRVKAEVARERSPQFRGWDPVGAESTNNRSDIREQFDVWSDWPVHDSPVGVPYLRLLGPNQWLPNDAVPGHRELMEAWMSECAALASDLLGLIAMALGLAEDHFEILFGEQPMSLAKFIHYPPTPEGGAGVNAHHDTGFLTVLATGSNPGLQVQNQDGEWIDVPTVVDSFVINLGEMLQAMTGNYLIATPHRVVTRTERYSAGYFHGPSLDAALTPLDLDDRFARAVAASRHHAGAGFMARLDETNAGVGDMASVRPAATYGQQLWNYFHRSYPDIMAKHHSDLV